MAYSLRTLSVAFNAPTITNASTGLTPYINVNNFATLIFTLSFVPLMSAIGTRLIAGGPHAINIIENHNIGS